MIVWSRELHVSRSSNSRVSQTMRRGRPARAAQGQGQGNHPHPTPRPVSRIRLSRAAPSHASFLLCVCWQACRRRPATVPANSPAPSQRVASRPPARLAYTRLNSPSLPFAVLVSFPRCSCLSAPTSLSNSLPPCSLHDSYCRSLSNERARRGPPRAPSP